MEKSPEQLLKDSPEQKDVYFDPQTGVAINFSYSVLDGRRITLNKDALAQEITASGGGARVPNYLVGVKKYLEAQGFIVEE